MTGKVFVENGPVLEELVESIDPQAWQDRGVREHKTIRKQTQSTENDHTKLLKEQEKQRAHQTELIMQQNIQKSLERKNEKQERMFPVLMSNLDKATSFLDIIDKDINLHDETQQNKIRRQFEDWNAVVHGSIQV
jgi:hypothetical protein